jgi:uncharacterized protein (TIGR03067 family)
LRDERAADPHKMQHIRRNFMHRLIAAVQLLMLGIALLSVSTAAAAAESGLQGNWTATKAERDGKAAADVVGHRLTFSGNGFRIVAEGGKLLYAGTFRTDAKAKPAAIDFEHTQAPLKGNAWKGIYTLRGDTLTICDNAPDLAKARPAAFEAKSGSGYVLVTFTRAKP